MIGFQTGGALTYFTSITMLLLQKCFVLSSNLGPYNTDSIGDICVYPTY